MSTTHVRDNRRLARRRAYQTPALVKGPVLTRVTASTNVSASNSDCWVARAAFGEQDLRWMIFREWLFGDAPAWFRNLYLRHGEATGGWLKGHAGARSVVRAAMAPAIRHVLHS